MEKCILVLVLDVGVSSSVNIGKKILGTLDVGWLERMSTKVVDVILASKKILGQWYG